MSHTGHSLWGRLNDVVGAFYNPIPGRLNCDGFDPSCNAVKLELWCGLSMKFAGNKDKRKRSRQIHAWEKRKCQTRGHRKNITHFITVFQSPARMVSNQKNTQRNEVPSISFLTFFVWAFKIVVVSWKFSMLLLYILWDDFRFKGTATGEIGIQPTKIWMSQLVNFKNANWHFRRTICNKILF